MMKERISDCLEETKVVAIIRGQSPEVCVKLAGAYREGGIRLVEVTFVPTGDPAGTVAATLNSGSTVLALLTVLYITFGQRVWPLPVVLHTNLSIVLGTLVLVVSGFVLGIRGKGRNR